MNKKTILTENPYFTEYEKCIKEYQNTKNEKKRKDILKHIRYLEYGLSYFGYKYHFSEI